MIVKRIRQGPRQERGSISSIASAIATLSRYFVDADPVSVMALGQVRGLSDYALDVRTLGAEPGEKVEAWGAFNLGGEGLLDHQVEMAAVAARAPRSRDPIEHFVFSWRQGEQPTAQQVEEAAAILLKVMSYGSCLAIWSWHSNTDHHHGHLVVVRIDPVTGKVAGSDWDIDRAHQAIALIEEKQGWSREAGALYEARESAVYQVGTGKMVRDAAGNEMTRDRRTKTTLPLEIDVAAGALRDAGRAAVDWSDFHARFRAAGAHYDKKGSGAVVRVGSAEAKASQIDPALARLRLEERFGPFTPDRSRVDPGYELYQDACRAELARLRAARAAEHERLQDLLGSMLSAARQSVDPRDWPALRASIQAEHGALRAAFDQAFSAARHGFASSRLSAVDWTAAGCPPAPLAAIPGLILPAFSQEVPASAPPPVIAGFSARAGKSRTVYRGVDGAIAFVDCRTAIIVMRPGDRSTVEAALRQAARRWGSVQVRGPADFIALSMRLAAANGITLTGADGQVLTSPSVMPVEEVSREQPPSSSPAESPRVPIIAAHAGSRASKAAPPVEPTPRPAADIERGRVPSPTRPDKPRATTQPVTPPVPHIDEWEAVLRRVERQGVAVRLRDTGTDVTYGLDQLSPADQVVLDQSRFASRLQDRLAAIYDRQRAEVIELKNWIEQHAHDPERLAVDGESVTLNVPDRIASLYGSWKDEDIVQRAIEVERRRRDDAEREARDAAQLAEHGRASLAEQAAFRRKQLGRG